MGIRIGFVSSFFSGSDAMGLEAEKWAEVLLRGGHDCFWWAGELDKDPERSRIVPEAHFSHPNNLWINERIIGKDKRSPAVTDMIHAVRSLLKMQLQQFIEDFSIDLLIVENALSQPVHVPLGLAIAECVAELQMPTVAHHHEFYWQRSRFSVNAVGDYILMAFPPQLPVIQHVVVDGLTQEQLAHRTGISATVIPHVLDFENAPDTETGRDHHFLRKLGVDPESLLFLLPTRRLHGRRVSHGIELVQAMKDPQCVLVVCCEQGEESGDEAKWLQQEAEDRGVTLRFVGVDPHDPWDHRKAATGDEALHRLYSLADFIVSPLVAEEFGNALLEAVYFRKPVLVNRMAAFVRDIEPLGFDLFVMDGYLTERTVREVKEVLWSHSRREAMVQHNFQLGARHFSLGVLQKRLNYLLMNFFGMEM